MLSCSIGTKKCPKSAGSALTGTGSAPDRVLGREFSPSSSAGSKLRRRAFTAAPAMQDLTCSWFLGVPPSPLAHFLPDRSTSRLQRLLAELEARYSIQDAAPMLETFLPCEKQVNTSVCNPLGKVARDIGDMEQTEPVVVAASKDAPALTAFLDGAHIRCSPEVQKRHLNVVVVKIESYDKCCRVSLV